MSDGRADTQPASRMTGQSRPRVLLTWFELTVVGFVGAALGTAVGGPPGFVLYLATGLLTVGILFYNVDELVAARLRLERE